MLEKKRELHVLKLQEGLVFWKVKNQSYEKVMTKEDRPFMDKLDKLVAVTSTVDLYFYLFDDEIVYKNKYKILLDLVDPQMVFKESMYKRYVDATRSDLKNKYNYDTCSNVNGQWIGYEDTTDLMYSIPVFWLTESDARKVIKRWRETYGE